jgi:hypothetical protein
MTRTLRDAVIAAADELGRIKYKEWSKQLEGEPENGIKGFFKVLAVRELRTFGIILARTSVESQAPDPQLFCPRPPLDHPVGGSVGSATALLGSRGGQRWFYSCQKSGLSAVGTVASFLVPYLCAVSAQTFSGHTRR